MNSTYINNIKISKMIKWIIYIQCNLQFIILLFYNIILKYIIMIYKNLLTINKKIVANLFIYLIIF